MACLRTPNSIAAYFTSENKENILSDLYNALKKIRYPELAQINYDEFEFAILTGNKRVELLHWLLRKNPKFDCNLFNKFNEPTLEGKLLKCYSQMGFCNSEDILLGKCKIDEQLYFLSLLTLFIKMMYPTDNELLKYDKETANSLSKPDIVSVSPKVVCMDEEKNDSLRKYSKSRLSTSDIDKQKRDSEVMCSDLKLIIQESSRHQDENYEPMLQKFHTCFKNTTSFPVKSSHSTQSSDDFNTDIEQIQTKFSVINKALINEVELNNRIVPENTDKSANPLSLLLKNNVVLIEQACNMLEENKKLS